MTDPTPLRARCSHCGQYLDGPGMELNGRPNLKHEQCAAARARRMLPDKADHEAPRDSKTAQKRRADTLPLPLDE